MKPDDEVVCLLREVAAELQRNTVPDPDQWIDYKGRRYYSRNSQDLNKLFEAIAESCEGVREGD